MKNKLSILALASAIAAPFSAFGRSMALKEQRYRPANPEADKVAIAAAKEKRLRKQQKRLATKGYANVV